MEVLSDAIRLFGVEPPKQLALWATLVSVAVTVPIGALFYLNSRPRQQNLPVYRERVLILGGSSGIGEATAVAYARRGCRSLVIVGRRAEELERVRVKCEQAAKEGDEWTQADKAPGWEERMGKPRVWTFKADCTSPEDVLRIREFVEQNLGGLDTLHICFGVSALRSLLGTADVEPLLLGGTTSSKAADRKTHANAQGLIAVRDAAEAASRANFTGTAVVLAGLIPLLQLSSHSPAIALISSVAAAVPAPTRAIYCATKSAQLRLFEAVSIECRAQHELTRRTATEADGLVAPRSHVRCVAICPATVRTAFRNSAVDGPADQVVDAAWTKGKKGSDILEPEQVADQAILAVDRNVEGTLFTQVKYGLAPLLRMFVPSLIDKAARKKYGY